MNAPIRIPHTIDERLAWAKAHIRSKEGRRFSLEGRQWVVDHFWRPANGWRRVARNLERLCDACKDEAGTIVESWDWAWSDRMRRHVAAKKDECSGLYFAPIICTVLNLPRREGKTFNVSAFVLATIFLSPRRFVLFLATAGEQTSRLFTDNIEAVINQSDAMRESCEIVGNQVRVPSTMSRLDVPKSTAHKSITGGGYTHIVLEEARDFDPRTVAATVLSIRDQGGYECPRDVRHCMKPGIGGEIVKHRCPVCGDFLLPWYPRIIIPSSSGIVEDSERDWFNQLVEQIEKEAPENYYLFRTEESTNPVVSKETTSALAAGFGNVEALKTYMDVELSNRPRRKGDDFLTAVDIDRIEDPSLQSLEGSDLQCVGYLDTSWSSDLTSIMIAGWDPEVCEYPWQQLRILHWQTWAPKMLGGHMKESWVFDHLERYVPNFPRLELFLIDDRGMNWSKELVIRCNQVRGWGPKIRAFHGKRVQKAGGKVEKQGNRIPGIFGGDEDRSRAWQLLEQRAMTGRRAIVIPKITAPIAPNRAPTSLRSELLGVTKVAQSDGGYEIRDRNRKKSHADLADTLAGVCLLAYYVATNQRKRLDPGYSARQNTALASIMGSGIVKGYGFGDF